MLQQKQHLVCLQLREKEAESDALIGPVEEMYALLRRYEVRVPAEELTAVSDLRYSWKKLLDLAVTVSDNLSGLQVEPERKPEMFWPSLSGTTLVLYAGNFADVF